MNRFFSKTRAWLPCVLFLCFFAAFLLWPMSRMLLYIDADSIKRVFGHPLFGQALLNSLTISLTSTVISLGLALVLAFCVTRSNMPGKKLFSALLVLPMLIPSISHGSGLIMLFGNNGFITQALGLSEGLYGFWMVVTGSVMYSFPVAFLMLADILRYENSTPYEAARVLGLSGAQRLGKLTLPYLKKPLINVGFAVFAMVVTDYGVPMTVSGSKLPTLPVMMYKDAAAMMDYGKGSVIGVVLLVPAVIAFLLDLLNHDAEQTGFETRPFDLQKAPWRDGLAAGFCSVVSLALLAPIAVFGACAVAKKYPVNMAFSFNHIVAAFDSGAGKFLGNSLIVSLLVALVGVTVAFGSAYITSRMPGKQNKLLHLVSILSLAVPGLVLGLSYALCFGKSSIRKTILILLLVNMMHFFSSPYLMMYNTLNKKNPNLEAVGATFGVGRLRMIKDVFLPQTVGTVLEMFAYFFVNSMMTISAVSFLSPPAAKPLALLLPESEGLGLLERAAFISLLILVANLLVKGAVALVRRWIEPTRKGIPNAE